MSADERDTASVVSESNWVVRPKQGTANLGSPQNFGAKIERVG